VLRGLSQLFEQDAGSKFKVQSSRFGKSPTLNLEPSTLNHLAARIGSDVPFFLTGGMAFVRGRGEVVEPLPDVGPWWLVIVKPPFGVSTAWAYQRLDEMRAAVSGQRSAVGEPKTSSARICKCIEAGDFRLLPRLLSNDLEAPAFERHPELPKVKDALVDAGALGALMCGSGSAVFGLFDNKEAATRGAEHLGSSGESFVAKTISRAEAQA
jgi:4-diphosphocytidyl-2-C-methyl-D-erythritol kinase